MWKLEKGDIVKCIIAVAGELTEDKEYKILDVDTSNSMVEIVNDYGEKVRYFWGRFDKEAL